MTRAGATPFRRRGAAIVPGAAAVVAGDRPTRRGGVRLGLSCLAMILNRVAGAAVPR
jgi:hypothetical protein